MCGKNMADDEFLFADSDSDESFHGFNREDIRPRGAAVVIKTIFTVIVQRKKWKILFN